MSAAQESRLHLEIAHVLFLDVVGYSRLLVNEQREIVQKLNDIVRATPQFRQSSASGKLICIATGDGMALLFFQSHPNFARAHAGIADCCSFLYMYWDGSKANLEAADASSQRALELDPASAEAHTSRGVALTLRRDYAGARREFDHALRLNPVLYEAHYFYGRACFTEGKFEEALLHYRNAWRVRPEDYQAILLSMDALAKLGRHDDVLEAARQGIKLADAHLELNPDDARAWYLSAAALVRLGQTDQALEGGRRAFAVDAEDAGVLYNLACNYALAGSSDEAIEHLNKAVQTDSDNVSGWKTIQPWIRYAGIRDSKLSCKNFNFTARRTFNLR